MKKTEEIYQVFAESLQRQDPETYKLSKQAKKEGGKERQTAGDLGHTGTGR